MKKLLILLITLTNIYGDPLLSSWDLSASRQYARIYQFQSDIDNQQSFTTWDHPTGNGDQQEPAYSGIHEVSYNEDFVYVRTTGMGAHIMGPWWRNRTNSTADNQIFVNWPGSTETIVSFPIRTNLASPPVPANRTETSGGPIGLFVDGVSMYDSRDAFSWDASENQDEQPNSPNTVQGDGYWERDAYINEGQTFDAANGHAANEQYHYHANPPALRYRLGDSVDYDSTSNTYTEAPNGKHSPILGWVRDGLPIYGPYGYDDPMDPDSSIRRMISGFQPRADLASIGSLRDSYPDWALRHQEVTALPSGQEGPAVSAAFPRGHYLQDYEYLGDLGQTQGLDFDLDEYNTRMCVTPEFPNGVRAYFVSIESNGIPRYPYNIGRQYYSGPQGEAYNNSDARANNDFITPAGLTIFAEGGPESAIDSVEIDTSTNDAILQGSAVEGGSYEIIQDTDLTSFEEMKDVSVRDLTNGKPLGEVIDRDTVTTEASKFYQISLESVAPFDDSGFQIDSVTQSANTATLTITLDSDGPADLSVVPNILRLNGDAVEFFSRPSANEITIYFNESLLSGIATLEAQFPGETTIISGTYEAPVASATSNILFVLIDDWGIDSSPLDNPNGADLPQMPNWVNFANEAIRFENAFVAPSCAPTRMAIMSGRLPYSTGVGSPGATATRRDATSIMSIAEAMDDQQVNYTSGLFGKWHLGNGTDPTNINDQGPAADGWDEFYGIVGGNIGNANGVYYNWTREDLNENLINSAGQAANETTYATTVNVNDALNFMTSNDNWLCWLAFNAPHSPFDAPPLTLNGQTYTGPIGTNRERYLAKLWALDNELGRLLEGIDLDTTTVILLGDNGTPRNIISDENLFDSSHGKGQIYDGGIHIPLLYRPAGGTTGRVEQALINGHDLFPTMCELMGINPSDLGQDLDGVSILPIVNGTDTIERYLVSETFDNDSGGRTIRKNQYKLNIYDDPRDNTDTPTLEFFDMNDGLDEINANNLLRANYTMTTVEQAAFDELIDYNVTLNTREASQNHGDSIQYMTN